VSISPLVPPSFVSSRLQKETAAKANLLPQGKPFIATTFSDHCMNLQFLVEVLNVFEQVQVQNFTDDI
jgi:hypothetical protein